MNNSGYAPVGNGITCINDARPAAEIMPVLVGARLHCARIDAYALQSAENLRAGGRLFLCDYSVRGHTVSAATTSDVAVLAGELVPERDSR